MNQKGLKSKAQIAKMIASKLSKELGFITEGTLQKAERDCRLIVIEDKGFVHFHHRKDGQTTIYEIGVTEESQRQGIGKQLICQVKQAARKRGQKTLFAKCPQGLPSNHFYKKIGFQPVRIEKGRKRKLFCWELKI